MTGLVSIGLYYMTSVEISEEKGVGDCEISKHLATLIPMGHGIKAGLEDNGAGLKKDEVGYNYSYHLHILAAWIPYQYQ